MSTIDQSPSAVQQTQTNVAIVGVLLVAGAAVLWSLNGALIKLMNREGAGGVAIAFYRSLIAGLFLLPLARGRFGTLRPRNQANSKLPLRPAAVVCVGLFTLMTLCFVLASTLTQAANAILLQYTSTFWIFGLSPWLLGEKPRRSDLWLLALAVVGIGIIIAGNASATLTGLIVALASGLFYGLLTIALRQLRDSNAAAVTVVNNLGAAALLFVPLLILGGFALTPRGWVLITLMGIVQFGLPYYLFAHGLARIPAYQAALITLLEPVLVPIWTYLAVGETVPRHTIIGGSLILVALLLLFFTTRRAMAVGKGTSGVGNDANTTACPTGRDRRPDRPAV